MEVCRTQMQDLTVEVNNEIHPNIPKIGSQNIKSTVLLPWDRFSNWIHCICVVTFDLELGQTMEIVYPGHVRLSEKEKINICYLSFPDSNSGCMGDTKFHFRIRQCIGTRRPYIALHHRYNAECPVALQSDVAHYFGYVYFRQMKDRSIRRGYFQKSVVIMSRFPFISLFYQLADIIAPEYFENGEPGLEAACHDIDQWPPPVPGDLLHLPVFGTVIQVRVASRSDKLIGYNKIAPKSKPNLPVHITLPSTHEIDIYSALQSVMSHIQLLWELVLLGEPIVVMASSPAQSSQAVEALIRLITPLKYCYDYRPYFTIHDTEFREYTSRTQAPPPIILGVTNPFFTKTLQHWPHVLRLGTSSLEGSPKPLSRVKKGGGLRMFDSKTGVYTKYKPFLNCDKAVLKRLLKGVQSSRPSEAQNAILKRFILELTQSFMIPLERYLGGLMPLQRNICPHKSTPQMKRFDPKEFLASLESSGPQLTCGVKGDWDALYRRFFRSLNFDEWYNQRQAEVNRKLQLLHVEALSNANLTEWVNGRQEVEIVDLILRLRENLTFARNQETLLSAKVHERLSCHIDSIVSQLPSDLQSVLLNG